MKEYQLVKTFHNTEDGVQFDPIKTTHFVTNQPSYSIIPNDELSAEIEEERRTEEMFNNPFKSSEKDRLRSKLLAKINLT